MLTTPRVARFQRLEESSSAMDTLKLARRRSFRLRTTCRLSLSDCAASMRSSRVRKAIIGSSVVSRRQTHVASRPGGKRQPTNGLCLRHGFRCDAFGDEGFDHIADFDVAVVGNRDAALHAIGNLAGIVLEPAQGAAFVLEPVDL